MIIRRYGTSMQSVELNFDSRALTEIGFRRDREWTESVEDFESGWERVEGWELEASSEGDVQDETEKVLLDEIEARIRELDEGLAEGEVLVVESEQGTDWPKTRHKTKTIVVEGENRLHFTGWIEPALRIARYRRRG